MTNRNPIFPLLTVLTVTHIGPHFTNFLQTPPNLSKLTIQAKPTYLSVSLPVSINIAGSPL